MKQKRLVTIQDLSCFGKCSLTVALPVISALGIETAVIPTAVLSTHTGECFHDYTFCTLEGELDKISASWQKNGLHFDAIYIGYIGSEELIDAVSRFIDKFRGEAVVFIDPAMADNGEFYRGINEKYAARLAELCRKADIISPNMTEALVMCGYAPSEKNIPAAELAKKLSESVPDVIITGIHNGESIVTADFEGKTQNYSTVSRKMRSGHFYGTGDLFASAFIGLYINGCRLAEAVEKAADFVSSCIENTLDEAELYRYGLKFEQSLGILTGYFDVLRGAGINAGRG